MADEGVVLVGGASEAEAGNSSPNGRVASVADTDIRGVFARRGSAMPERWMVGFDKISLTLSPPLQLNRQASAIAEPQNVEYSLPILPTTNLETVTDGLDDSDASLPTLPPNPESALLFGAQKRNREDFIADSSDPPVFSSDDSPPSADNYKEIRTNRRVYQGNWWDKTRVQNSEEQGTQKRGASTRINDSVIRLASDDDQKPGEIMALEESGLPSVIYPGCFPFRSRHNWPLVADPEEATKFEVTEVLPTSGPGLEAFLERLATYQKAHRSNWFRIEDGAPGSQKLVRISNADKWDGIWGKQHAAEKVEYCVEHGIEVVHLA